MTNQFNIATTRLLALGLSIALLVFVGPVFAHGGFEHVRGTVVKVADHVLTVKTAKGNVDVRLDEHTELTRSGQMVQLTDLKAGTRVIAEVPESSKDRLARTVKIGAVPKAASTHTHGSHK